MKRASSICVGAREGLVSGCKCRRDNPRLYGAGEGNRTPDLLITSEPLCRLSYPGLEPPRLSAPRQKYRQYRKRHTRVGAIGPAALRRPLSPAIKHGVVAALYPVFPPGPMVRWLSPAINAEDQDAVRVCRSWTRTCGATS